MTYLPCFLRKGSFAFFILLFLLSSHLPARAASSGQPGSAEVTCTIHAPSGWVPYRIQPGDTLATIATQRGVTIEQLRQVNCLQSADVRPNTLLLAPSQIAPHSVPSIYIATPTLPPLPTATPVPATPVLLPTVMPTLTVTPPLPPGQVSKPTATAQVTTAGQTEPPTSSHTQEGTQTPSTADPRPDLAGQLWLMVVMLVIIIAFMAYFALHDIFPARLGAKQGWIYFGGYGLLILVGYLIGWFAPSQFGIGSMSKLPIAVGGLSTLLLVSLLVVKEATSPWGDQGQALLRFLNRTLVPLFGLFLVTSAARLAAFLR